MAHTHKEAVREIIIGVAIAVISAVAIFFLIPNHEDGPPAPPDPAPSVESEPRAGRSQPPPRPRQVDVSGTYRGTAVNTTYNLQGGLRLVLNQETSGKLTGTVNFTGALTGSGPLEGHVSGRKVGFTSIEPSTGISIAWSGIMTGDTLEGDYTVSMPTAVKAANPYVPDQDGRWTASR